MNRSTLALFADPRGIESYRLYQDERDPLLTQWKYEFIDF